MGEFAGASASLKSRRGMATAAVITSLISVSGIAHATSHHHAKAVTPVADTASGDTCKPTPEQASIGIRALQTELMVAGLKCSADQWNTFTAQFKATIRKDADRMQSVFRKVYGKSGSTEMNSFVTQLANDASQRSNGSSEADYCKQEDVLFHKVLALTGEQLERFSVGRALAVPAPVTLCKPDPETPDATTTQAANASPANASPANASPGGSSVVASTAPAVTPVTAKSTVR